MKNNESTNRQIAEWMGDVSLQSVYDNRLGRWEQREVYPSYTKDPKSAHNVLRRMNAMNPHIRYGVFPMDRFPCVMGISTGPTVEVNSIVRGNPDNTECEVICYACIQFIESLKSCTPMESLNNGY